VRPRCVALWRTESRREVHNARATADADATWRTTADALQAMLEDAAEVDLADVFEFLIGRGRAIQAEAPEGGLRFPVHCLLAGRAFETLRLDINVVPGDPRPLDHVELRNLFDFTDLPPVVVPAVRPEQQLAEKIHADTRNYGHEDNNEYAPRGARLVHQGQVVISLD